MIYRTTDTKCILHVLLLILLSLIPKSTKAFGGVSSRFFLKQGVTTDKPKLILIGGCPGTGKSTFGMSVALDQGILKCISTDTIRAVMRSFVQEKVSPALHRSSYAASFEGDDPVRSWKETCSVLSASVEELIDDAIKRGQSIVVEGVHVVPDKTLINKWEEAGGVAIGCLLQIKDEDKHKRQLRRRGVMTGAMEAEETKIMSFGRIRAIQDEMMRLAKESQWLQIEQRTAPDPLDLVAQQLTEDEDCELPAEFNFEQQVAEMEETNGSFVDLPEMTDLSHQGIDEKSTEGAVSS